MRRRWVVRLGIAAVLLALIGVARAGFDSWRARAILSRARAEIDRGRYETARRSLATLSRSRPGFGGGAVDYWLGVCEAARGQAGAALAAFARVPAAFEFEPRGAYFEARANLERGRLHAAERRLLAALRRGAAGRDDLRSLLVRVYQVEVRFDDAAALLREGLASSPQPLGTLKELADLDRGSLPCDGLRRALEEARRLAPEDERVWLGLARLESLEGHWDTAAGWLGRCPGAKADAPIWRARLDWALGSDRPADALEAARHLGDGDLNPADRLAVVARFFELQGDDDAERRALTLLQPIQPGATRALERLAAIAHRAGQLVEEARFRQLKAQADRDLERYRRCLQEPRSIRTAADRIEMVELAERLGHPAEARAWAGLALKADSNHPEAHAALARIDRTEARNRDLAASVRGPWAEFMARARSGRALASAAPSGRIRFQDDAEAAGLRFTYQNGQTPLHQLPEPLGGGLALLDFDGDGLLDVYCVQGGRFPPGPDRPAAGDRLFRNLGDGRFADVTESAGLAVFARGYGHGVAVGDVDNDGHPDLFVTRWRGYDLYHNEGDGTFADITESAGLGGDRDWPTSAAFADLDGDGDLDLYVCHYAAWDAARPPLCRDPTTHAYISCNPLESAARPDHLFRNDGGRFVDVSAEAGIDDRDGRGLGVVAADIDDDGRLDLYVANDMTANFLWRNLGGLRFEESAHAAGVAGNAGGGYQAGMGIAAGDLDGDGRIDLAVTNFYGEATTLFRNLGGGAFHDAGGVAGLAATSRYRLGFGIVFADVNNDGLLDLATANGHVNDFRPNFPYMMPAQLLAGAAGGRLVDMTDRAGPPWRAPRMGRGLVSGDLDNDGRIDLVLLGQNQPLAYFHNQTEGGGHRLSIRLEGTRSNRDAVGAQVALVAGGRRRVAWRLGGGSYQSSSDPRLHFGLGAFDRVEAIEVRWPSGHVDRLRDLPADTGYLLREGRAEALPSSSAPIVGPRRSRGD